MRVSTSPAGAEAGAGRQHLIAAFPVSFETCSRYGGIVNDLFLRLAGSRFTCPRSCMLSAQASTGFVVGSMPGWEQCGSPIVDLAATRFLVMISNPIAPSSSQ